MKTAEQVVPSTVDEVLHALGDLGGCWVADGAWGFDRGRFRRGCVVATPEEAPRIAWDGYVTPDDLDLLARILGARRADGDAMFATAWKLMWTCDGGPLRVIDREGLLLRADNGLADVRGAGIIRPVRVEAWVDPDWVRRGVRLIDALGDEVLLAETHEWVAQIDPTYDWLDLDCDAGWASAAASAIGRALGVEVVITWDRA